jgi:hypothetical protein
MFSLVLHFKKGGTPVIQLLIQEMKSVSAEIKNLDEAYIIQDNIEVGSLKEIPLWAFGFLY